MPVPLKDKVKNFDNTLAGLLINHVENPDSIGFINNVWYSPKYDKRYKPGVYDPANFGIGVDRNENEYAKTGELKFHKDKQGREYLTIDEERNARHHLMEDAEQAYYRRLAHAQKVTKSKNIPSEMKKAITMSAIYNLGSKRVSDTLFEDKKLMETLMNGSDMDYSNEVNRYFRKFNKKDRDKHTNEFIENWQKQNYKKQDAPVTSNVETPAFKYNDGILGQPPQRYVQPKVTSDTYNDGMPVLKSEGGQIEKRKLWNDLSIAEKSEMMKVAIQNGITSLKDIRAKYNEFAEGGDLPPYSAGKIADALWSSPNQEYLGDPSHHYDFTQSEVWANAHGYYPDNRGHRDDRVKKPSHPSHPSKGNWSKDGNIFNLTDVGMRDPNYIFFGLADGDQDPQASLMYKDTIVLPEITVTPNGNHYLNPYDNYKLSFAEGGPEEKEKSLSDNIKERLYYNVTPRGYENAVPRLFDGTSQPSQQMNRGPYITRGVAENGTPYYTGTYSPELQSYLDPVWFNENGEYNIGLPEVTVGPSGEQLVNSGREKAFGYIGPILDAAASFNPLWGTISGVAHGLESAKDIYDNGLNLGNALGVGLGIGLPMVHVPRLYNKGIQAITKNGNKIVKANVTTKNISNSSKLPFESELDWSPEGWLSKRENGIYDAEDVAALQSHIPEYIGIEKAAKENNTWLKLPDGSIWQGDPRSWVQLQSKDGKKLIMRELFHGNDDRYIGSGGIDETPNVLGRKALWTSTNPNVSPTYGRHKYIFTIPKGTEGIEYDAKGANWNRIEHKPGFKVDTNDIARTFADDNNVLIIRNVVDRGADPRPRPGIELPSYLSKETLSDYNKRVFLGDDYIIGKNIPRKSLLANNGNFDLSNPNIYKGITPFAVSTLFLEPQR